MIAYSLSPDEKPLQTEVFLLVYLVPPADKVHDSLLTGRNNQHACNILIREYGLDLSSVRLWHLCMSSAVGVRSCAADTMAECPLSIKHENLL